MTSTNTIMQGERIKSHTRSHSGWTRHRTRATHGTLACQLGPPHLKRYVGGARFVQLFLFVFDQVTVLGEEVVVAVQLTFGNCAASLVVCLDTLVIGRLQES